MRISLLLSLLILQGCMVEVFKSDKELLSFQFLKKFNTSLDKDYTAKIKVGKDDTQKEIKTVSVTLPVGTDATSLIASFTNSETAIVNVLGKLQISGKTQNDFTSPVMYTVQAADKTKTNYTVTVTV